MTAQRRQTRARAIAITADAARAAETARRLRAALLAGAAALVAAAALAAALTPTGAHAADLPPPPPRPDWANGQQVGDWIYVSASDDLVAYRHAPYRGPDGRPRLAVRWEYRNPESTGEGKTILSVEEVDAFDCAAGRYFVLSAKEYAGYDLTGESEAYTFDEPVGIDPEPGSVGYRLFVAACGAK